MIVARVVNDKDHAFNVRLVRRGWDRDVHLRGVRETWNLPARKTEAS